MSKKDSSYPTQMASIKKNDWRMGEMIDKGLSSKELEREENKLWKQITQIAGNSTNPPKTHPLFPNSQLLGHGWEWAVYELQGKSKVVKLPAGVFWEVNELRYLKNTMRAYEVCKRYLKDFVVDTTFERSKHMNQTYNTLKQRKIDGDEITFINPSKISTKLKKHFTEVAQAMLVILSRYDWIPDMHLERKVENSEKGWNICNLILENDVPRIFDFTAYYDVWRLYPQRTEKEKRIKGKFWQDFLKELSS